MMNKTLYCLFVAALLATTQAEARDDRVKFKLEPFLSSEKARQALLDVPVYFSGQANPEPVKVWGEVTTSRKTNAFGKSDQEACEWVLLSALKVLQQKALEEGMDGVINIKSNYKHNEFASADKFECGAGNIIAGVALKGDIVKFSE